MAHGRRDNQPQSSGLLSGVFNFVSREIESFVTTATGREPQKHHETKSLTSCDESSGRGESGKSREARPHSSDSQQSSHMAHSRSPEVSSPVHHIQSRDRSEYNGRLYPRTSSPPHRPSTLKRRQSLSMPGSLFPRSPSLIPDSLPQYLDDDERHVRFASAGFSPIQGNSEAGPSRPRDIPCSQNTICAHGNTSSFSDHAGSFPRSSSSSFRSRGSVSNVKDAVMRFRVDKDGADASILLPREKSLTPGKKKEKQRASDASPTGSSPREKGKYRALDLEPEYHHAVETSGEVRVRRKGCEQTEAREDQRKKARVQRDMHDGQVEADEEGVVRNEDKAKIKMLEEEVLRLKAELSRRPIPGASIAIPPPPPPPPPLPPNVIPIQSQNLASTSATSPGSLFTSARAALKHTSTPIETPINLGASGIGNRAKRQGHPTVNISGEKMAAFLNEMKTVRLRKVSTGADSGPSVPPNNLTRSWSAGSGPGHRDPSASSRVERQGLPVFRSLDNRADSQIGEKRKRDTISHPHDDIDIVAKRRTITSTSKTELSKAVPCSVFQAASQPQRTVSQTHTANKIWPSTAVETDLTTPELCSDNEPEIGGNSSIEDRPPSTPPIFDPPSLRQQAASTTGKNKDVDVNMELAGFARQAQLKVPLSAVSPRGRRDNELFTKRPPTSPIPHDTPRKPRPPARSVHRKWNPRQGGESEDDDDPLSLSFTSPDVIKTPSQCSSEHECVSHETESRSGPQNASERRLTLDQEMRDARTRSLLCEADGADLDSGLLVGVGTKNKAHGFLAHGGAGGLPVFMGDGYVDSAEVSGEETEEYVDENDGEYLPQKTTSARRSSSMKRTRR